MPQCGGLSRVCLFATAGTAAPQAPLSMGFSRQEHWSGLPCPPAGDLPSPGIQPRSPALQADSLPAESSGKPKNTGMGSLSLLWNFPTQELNRGVLHWQADSLPMSYLGNSQWVYFKIYKEDKGTTEDEMVGWHD